jgi:hypothetical protein
MKALGETRSSEEVDVSGELGFFAMVVHFLVPF